METVVVNSLLALIVAFGAAALLGPLLIPVLHKLQYRQLELFRRGTTSENRAQCGVIIAKIIADHHPILPAYHHQQHHEEGGRGELQSQQQEFPEAMALTVVLKGSSQGDMCINISWDNACDEQYHKTGKPDHPQIDSSHE